MKKHNLELDLFHTKTLTSLHTVSSPSVNSRVKVHSKFTLAILLVVLMCQILATGSAFSVQYPGGEHPMGFDVNHHHVHSVSHSFSNSFSNRGTISANESSENERRDSGGNAQNHGHQHGAFNATEPVVASVHFQASHAQVDYSPLAYGSEADDSVPNLSPASESLEAEHEHANHSHTPSHPPVDSVFMSGFFQSETLIDDDISYLNLRYAPPIPPPHA